MDDPVRHIMMALRDVTSAMQDRIRTEVGPLGLGMPQMLAMRRIVLGGPTTLSQLAEATGVTKGAMSPIVQGLVDAGMVTRRPDDDDRRVQWIEATTLAKATKERVERRMGGIIEGLVADWDMARRERFAEDLEALQRSLSGTRDDLEAAQATASTEPAATARATHW